MQKGEKHKQESREKISSNIRKIWEGIAPDARKERAMRAALSRKRK